MYSAFMSHRCVCPQEQVLLLLYRVCTGTVHKKYFVIFPSLPHRSCLLSSQSSLAPVHQRAASQVVVLGDTCDASTMAPLARDADVVIHEATNAFLLPMDQVSR